MAEINGASLELLRAQREIKTHVDSGYKIRVSNEYEDREWDAFVAGTPGGHYAQTSLWSQVKASLGWHALRIVISRQDKIVAGAQILIHPLTLAGAIGYVPKGPILAQSPILARADTRLPGLILQELKQVAKRLRVQYLAVELPINGEALAPHLLQTGFCRDTFAVEPAALVRLDLLQNSIGRLGLIGQNNFTHLASREPTNFTFREGAEADLPALYQLLQAGARSESSTCFEEEYLLEMWRILHAHQSVKLFLAEHAGEMVAAQFAILLGDTIVGKFIAWSEKQGTDYAQALLYGAVSKWAKGAGFRYYIVEQGTPMVELNLHHKGLSAPPLNSMDTLHKLNLEGEVKHYPGVYTYMYNPFLKWTYRAVLPKLIHSSPLATIFHRLTLH